MYKTGCGAGTREWVAWYEAVLITYDMWLTYWGDGMGNKVESLLSYELCMKSFI